MATQRLEHLFKKQMCEFQLLQKQNIEYYRQSISFF
jgi:hypothetical protein